MSSRAVVPLRTPLFVALAFAWMWGVIGGSVGLNALIKSNQSQSRFRKKVPPTTIVTINVNDVYHSGIVLTTIGTLIAVLCTVFVLLHFFLPSTHVRTLRTQSFLLAFCAVWLFSALVPFTVFVATRGAHVRAFIGGAELPAQVIQSVERSLGATTVYRKLGYLKLVAILPWFTLLFTVVAAVVTFLAASRQAATATPYSGSGPDMVEKRDHESDEGRTSGVTKE